MTSNHAVEVSLREHIQSIGVIDNHCHPLVQDHHGDSIDLRGLVSEAAAGGQGALDDAVHTLAYRRSAKQLEALYPPRDKRHLGISLEDRRLEHWGDESSREKKIGAVFRAAGVQGLLIDDGFGVGVRSWQWHGQFFATERRVRRVLRIESVAEEVLRNMKSEDDATSQNFLDRFDSCLNPLPPGVCALKSIAAYRGGLRLPAACPTLTDEQVVQARLVCRSGGQLRDVDLVAALVVRAFAACSVHDIPIQFHTGLGDRDMELPLANPTLLRPLLERHPHVKVVLLHGAYPFTREAGYLCSVYKNVYLDFGLAIPLLSARGCREVLNMCLELVPTNKLLYSSDAHGAVDMFYLASTTARNALADVLSGSVDDGDINLTEAKSIARMLLHGNANSLYKLAWPQDDEVTEVAAAEGQQLQRGIVAPPTSAEILDKINAVRLMWIDANGLRRVRIVPRHRLGGCSGGDGSVLSHGLGITKAIMGLVLQWDAVAPNAGVDATGEVQMCPVIDTACVTRSIADGRHATCAVEFYERPVDPNATSVTPRRPWALCPRNSLKRALTALKESTGHEILAGFETEFVILKEDLSPTDVTSYCLSDAMTVSATAVMDEIVKEIEESGVGVVNQFHPEAALGQFEVSLCPQPALQAADSCVMTREIIASVCRRHHLRATFVPKPFETQAGNGNHVHLSIWKDGKNAFPCAQGERNANPVFDGERANRVGSQHMSKDGCAFMAGVLGELSSLLAVTTPCYNSFQRIVPGCWAGAYACWGLENRECPVRLCTPAPSYIASNFEVKCVDNTCNPYLALAAIVAAGSHGIHNASALPEPVLCDPHQVAEELSLEALPTSLKVAIEKFENNHVLRDGLGTDLHRCLVAVRKGEDEHFASLSPEVARETLLSRY